MDNSILIRAGMFDDLVTALRRCHAALESHPGGDNRDEADRIYTATTLALAEAEKRGQTRLWDEPPPATAESLIADGDLPAFLRRQA